MVSTGFIKTGNSSGIIPNGAHLIFCVLQICILLVLYFKKRHDLNHILLDIEHHDIL